MSQPELFPIAPEDAEIRVLTLHRPWPQSMHGTVEMVSPGVYAHVPGPKAPENRSWHPPRELVGRCWIALQSGLTFDGEGERFLRERGWRFPGPHPSGCITGVGFLSDSFGFCKDRVCPRCTDPLNHPLGRDPFYMKRVAWVLTGRVPLIEPVPCRGGQGLRRLDPDVKRQLVKQYRRTITAIGAQLPPGPRMT